jgi:hypothetical protein
MTFAASRKPNSVPAEALAGFGQTTIIPLVAPLLARSSDRPGSFGRAVLERFPIWSCSVRGFACHPCCHGRGALLPHLFTLTRLRRADPATAQQASRARRAEAHSAKAGGMFSVPLVLQVTLTGRYPAHCPAEFGLSSLRRPDPKACTPDSDHLAYCERSIVQLYNARTDGPDGRPCPAHSCPSPIRPFPA